MQTMRDRFLREKANQSILDNPIVIKSHPAFLFDLSQEEYGSFEDAKCPAHGTPWMMETPDVDGVEQPDEDGGEHPYNIITRHNGKLELRNLDEAETLIRHVLDNSIDKARGYVDEARGWPGTGSPEYGKAYRWVKNLEKLQERIRKEISLRTSHKCDATDDYGVPLNPDRVTCNGCGNSWCERCDPSPSPLCHWCHGRGFSTASLNRKED